MGKIFTFLSIIFSCLLGLQGNSQNSLMVSGQVLDSAQGLGITSVSISTEGKGILSMTADQGRFRLKLDPGEVRELTFEHPFYETKTIPLIFDSRSGIDIKVMLHSKTIKLAGVTIEGKRPSYLLHKSVPSLELSREGVPDAATALRAVPNMSAIRRGGTSLDPVLRGMRYAQLNVMIDNGIKIEGGCPNRMDPAMSHIEMEDVEKVEVYKGPYVLRYGPAFGGVISLNTLRPKPFENFHIEGTAFVGYESNWNGIREHLSVRGGNSKLYFIAGGGYKNYGNYSGDGEKVNSSYLKYNYSAGLGFVPGKGQEVIFDFKGSHGRDVRYPALPMDELSDDTYIGSVDYSLRNITSRMQRLECKLYTSNVSHAMDNAHRSNYTMMQGLAEVKARNTGGRMMAFFGFDDFTLNAGADFESIYKEGDRTMTMIMNMPPAPPMVTTKHTNLWLDAQILNTGLFAEYRKIGRYFDFSLATRLDLNHASSGDTLQIMKDGISYFDPSDNQDLNLSLSLGFSKKISDWNNISVSLGRGVRSAGMTERYIKFLTVGYDNFDYLGDPQLKPEVNYEADLNLDFAPYRWGVLRINAFAAVIVNYITGKLLPPSVATPKTTGALGVKQFYNAGYAFFRGAELTYQSPGLGHFGFELQGAYTRASLNEATLYVIENNQVVGEKTLRNDPLPEVPPLEFGVSAFGSFFSDQLIPKIKLRMATEQNYVSKAFYEAATPSFFLVDINLLVKPFQPLTFSLGVNNLLDVGYYEHLNRKIVGSTEKLYEPGRVMYVNVQYNF